MLLDASDTYYPCHPAQQTEGHTFLRLTRVFEGYIASQYDLGNRSCKGTCSDYKSPGKQECYKRSPFCHHITPCMYPKNCEYFSDTAKICKSSLRSVRRYDFAEIFDEFGKKIRYGKVEKETCERLFEPSLMTDSGRVVCSLCTCKCEDDITESHRYFSITEQKAYEWDNYVVIGMRFIKKNKIIYPQVKAGKLLPFGKINPNGMYWIEIEQKFTGAEHYYKVSSESNIFHIDVIQANTTDVAVTGVRFAKIDNGIHLSLEFTPFDFNTGKLASLKSYWVENFGDSIKIEIDQNADVPTKPYLGKPARVSTSSQFIQFGSTSFEADMAQTTIPFLDAREVIPDPLVVLSGIGLMYKTSRNSGGFIAPFIVPYDQTPNTEWIRTNDVEPQAMDEI